MESWSNQTGSLRFQDVCERLRMKLNTVAYLEGHTNQSIWWALGLEIHLPCKDIWLQVAKAQVKLTWARAPVSPSVDIYICLCLCANVIIC